MRNAISIILALLVSLTLSAGRVGAAEVALAANGRARLDIVVGDQADASVRESARELADMLGRIVGAPFTVKPGDGRTGIAVGMPGDFPVLAGLEGLSQLALKTPVALPDLAAAQSYLLRSHDQGVYVIGASELAVEFAVWDLLYRLGYRQFFPGPLWEVVPREANPRIAVDVLEKPDYFDRRIWYNFGGNKELKRAWDFRNRMNAHSWTAADGRPSMPPQWKTTFVNNHHAYGGIVAAIKAAYETQPDYPECFALIGGKRNIGGVPCIANPKVPPRLRCPQTAQIEETA